MCAFATSGGTMLEPDIYEAAVPGRSVIGGPAGPLASVLESAAPVIGTHNMPGAVWENLAVNCSVATIAAVSGLRYREYAQRR